MEFAVVALALYILIAGALTFGSLFYSAQGLQTAVDSAARELARTELPATQFTLEQVIRGNANDEPELSEVRKQWFDEHYLVLNLDSLQGRPTLRDLIADLPLLNQQLVPLMISDTVGGVRVLRYPGAVFTDSDSSDDPSDPPPSGFRVSIPLIVSRDGLGAETIDWIPPVEEIDSESNPDPFLASSPSRGVVALRLNYPVQSAAMSSFRVDPTNPFEPNIGNVNLANDGSVTVVDQDGYTPSGMDGTASDNAFGPTSGTYGLGKQLAFGTEVRPFRKVISVQAVFRREVYR